MINEFIGQSFQIKPEGMNLNVQITGTVALEQLGADASHFDEDMWALVVVFIASILLSYALLKWHVKERR